MLRARPRIRVSPQTFKHASENLEANLAVKVAGRGACRARGAGTCCERGDFSKTGPGNVAFSHGTSHSRTKSIANPARQIAEHLFKGIDVA